MSFIITQLSILSRQINRRPIDLLLTLPQDHVAVNHKTCFFLYSYSRRYNYAIWINLSIFAPHKGGNEWTIGNYWMTFFTLCSLGA